MYMPTDQYSLTGLTLILSKRSTESDLPIDTQISRISHFFPNHSSPSAQLPLWPSPPGLQLRAPPKPPPSPCSKPPGHTALHLRAPPVPRGCAPVESPPPAKFSTKTRTLQRGGHAGRIENVAAASSARNRPRGTCGSAVRRDHSMRQSVESDGGDASIPPAVLCGVSARTASRRSGRRAAMHWIMGDSFFFPFGSTQSRWLVERRVNFGREEGENKQLSTV
jgi:hypothetical protein